jgi:hypothetical protein
MQCALYVVKSSVCLITKIFISKKDYMEIFKQVHAAATLCVIIRNPA